MRESNVAVRFNEGIPKAPWLGLILVLLGIGAVFTVYRVYQHATAFTVGMDYFAPEFQTYWMNLFYAQLPLLTLLGAAIIGRLWMTRDRNVMQISPREELRRYFVLLSSLVVFGVIIYLVASVYTEVDAAWHQVTVRDTDFTPTHITLFYFGIPCFIISALTAFTYAHTRLPQFSNRVSLPFALLVAGPVMIMPNLGLNEWGHTFFYAEELFAASIHWGFVLLGWSAFAAGGLVVQLLSRMTELTRLAETAPSVAAAGRAVSRFA